MAIRSRKAITVKLVAGDSPKKVIRKARTKEARRAKAKLKKFAITKFLLLETVPSKV